MEQPKALSTYMTDRIDMVTSPQGCWTWTGSVDVHGYGVDGRRKSAVARKAHRSVYISLIGPIPDGMPLDHLCHNRDMTCAGVERDCLHRRCVNPAHLEAVTPGENTLRAIARNGPAGMAAVHAAQTTCVKGHPFSGWNGKQRVCIICRREISRRYEAKKRKKAA